MQWYWAAIIKSLRFPDLPKIESIILRGRKKWCSWDSFIDSNDVILIQLRTKAHLRSHLNFNESAFRVAFKIKFRRTNREEYKMHLDTFIWSANSSHEVLIADWWCWSIVSHRSLTRVFWVDNNISGGVQYNQRHIYHIDYINTNPYVGAGASVCAQSSRNCKTVFATMMN